MLGKYKAVLALLLLIILVPLTLLMTLGLWVPALAGIWLPLGTRIALDESPRITRKGLIIPISVIWWRSSACAYHQRQPFTSQPLVIERRHGRT